MSIIFLTTLAQYSLRVPVPGHQLHPKTPAVHPPQGGDGQVPGPAAEGARPLRGDRQRRRPPHQVALRDLRYIRNLQPQPPLPHPGAEPHQLPHHEERWRPPWGQGLCPVPHQLPGEPVLCEGVHKLELTLITGETLPISQPKRKTFLAQLTDYWGDML